MRPATSTSYPAQAADKSAALTDAVILASGSPTRARLLTAAGVRFGVDAPNLDEAGTRIKISDGRLAARALAEAKARAVSPQHPGALVIGADQVLAFDGGLLGKAGSRDEARRQLERLRGHTHTLHTSVAVARHGATLWAHDETAELTMRSFSATALDRYLDQAGPAVWQSPGAYHLEGLGAQLFDKVRGDYFSILGLPLLPLLSFLRSQGALPE